MRKPRQEFDVIEETFAELPGSVRIILGYVVMNFEEVVPRLRGDNYFEPRRASSLRSFVQRNSLAGIQLSDHLANCRQQSIRRSGSANHHIHQRPRASLRDRVIKLRHLLVQCLIVHIADKDEFFPPEGRAKVVEAVKGHQRIAAYVYPNADHAFARVGSVHWDGRSAAIANGRSAEALVAALG